MRCVRNLAVAILGSLALMGSAMSITAAQPSTNDLATFEIAMLAQPPGPIAETPLVADPLKLLKHVDEAAPGMTAPVPKLPVYRPLGRSHSDPSSGSPFTMIVFIAFDRVAPERALL